MDILLRAYLVFHVTMGTWYMGKAAWAIESIINNEDRHLLIPQHWKDAWGEHDNELDPPPYWLLGIFTHLGFVLVFGLLSWIFTGGR